MGKNNGKGGKGHKKRKNKNVDDMVRQLIFKEEGQVYGQILKVLGNGRFQVECYDKDEKIIEFDGKGYRSRIQVRCEVKETDDDKFYVRAEVGETCDWDKERSGCDEGL